MCNFSILVSLLVQEFEITNVLILCRVIRGARFPEFLPNFSERQTL